LMKDGILILNKTQDWTSHDCVAVCRRVLRLKGVKKIGHGGTLDPMACGVLPIYIGKATRLMEYTDLDDKTYRCTARLGLITDTLDIWGETLEERSTEGITEKAIREALGAFHGEIEQYPPMYSSVRVNGKRLYQYAREGETVEVKPRKVTIREFIIENIDMEKMEVSFEVTCSKGTYIRTICSDLGEALGCGAAMSALTRVASGIFRIEDGVDPEALKTMEEDEIEKFIIDTEKPLVHFGKIEMSEDRAKYFKMGNAIRWKRVKVIEKPKVTDDSLVNKRGRSYSTLYSVFNYETGEFLGTGYYDEKSRQLKADKILVDR
ncbi:MAG: tRNA pseudouridine(55) synthase TruB, partial [Firmicutes bacterium]|nr:tRNA pseudouridine(55) synthase TruB [Bacillota bacterium]